MFSSTSVPWPGLLRTTAAPPCRVMRPTIDSETPRRSASTDAGSNPTPRSRTKTVTLSPSTSTNTWTRSTPANLAALTIASRAAGGRPQPVLGDEEPHDPDADEDDAGRQADGDDARRSFGERRPGRRRPPGSLRLVGLAPDDRHAHGGSEQWPHEGIPEPQAE